MMPIQRPKEYSEETARQIDEEVKQILLEAHGGERDILVAHRTALEELVLAKEVVDRQALQGDPKSTEHRQPQRKKTRRGHSRKRKPSEQTANGNSQRLGNDRAR